MHFFLIDRFMHVFLFNAHEAEIASKSSILLKANSLLQRTHIADRSRFRKHVVPTPKIPIILFQSELKAKCFVRIYVNSETTLTLTFLRAKLASRTLHISRINRDAPGNRACTIYILRRCYTSLPEPSRRNKQKGTIKLTSNTPTCFPSRNFHKIFFNFCQRKLSIS